MSNQIFSFDDTLPTEMDEVRFYISDVRANDGPLPNDENLSNALIERLLVLEGSVPCAVAACFEHISAAWQARPVFGVSELGTTHGRVAEGFTAKAEDWRTKCATSGGSSGGDNGNQLEIIGTNVRGEPYPRTNRYGDEWAS